jgi:hypothetical protein
MTCDVARELLPGWVDRDSSGPDAEVLRLLAEHLEACVDCRARARELEETVALVRALPRIEMPWTLHVKARALGRRHVEQLEAAAVPLDKAFRAAVSPPSAVGMRPVQHLSAPRRRGGLTWVVIVAALVALAALAYWLTR